jgi:DNA-binding IscR family transcriptional regulator
MSTNSQFSIMVHILTLIACSDDPLSSAYISGSVNTNPVTIRRMVGELRVAGLVDTIPGSNGGTVLAKSPEQINLGEVYQLVKSETFFGLHPNQPNPYCPVGRNIQGVLKDLFTETDYLVYALLEKITIADILKQVKLAESAA